ncbi:hypothetical protein DFH28DRAFT_893692 [Melampsora americana]|nr:hypothetical protein DFH28DRAFT_893692 [Melampsora americana]
MTHDNNLLRDPQLWRRQTNISTSTLTLTLTLTALLSQSDMRTQTILLTSVITQTETITNNNQIKTSTAIQAMPTSTNSDNVTESSQATTLTSSIPSPTVSSIQRTQNTTATLAGMPTPTIIPVTSTSLPTGSSKLSLCQSYHNNSIAPSLQSSQPVIKSPSNNNENKIAIPAIVISITIALAFLIICISYLYPRLQNNKKTKQSGQMFDEYSKLAKTFDSTPSNTTLDYSQAYIPKTSLRRDKGKSRLIENLDEHTLGRGVGFQHQQGFGGRDTWVPQTLHPTEPLGPIV